ncbi:MAG TPA: cytochrome c oxidase subunit 3 family protein [Blastocatellia bacterium]|nr:cytochrome c oxidase subunit 3 family protein [Blastocatellia bacterium]
MAESHTATHARLAHHFDNMEQQREAGTLGMWTFLITEIMFFGGLFLAYILYRSKAPDSFMAASAHLDWKLGGVNTIVLIVSSLTMALAVYYSQKGNRRMLITCLLLTMAFGATFLVIKGFEYHEKFVDHLIPGFDFHWHGAGDARYVQLFYWLYFAMTGVHALHMVVGLGIMTVITIMAARGKFTPVYHSPVEIAGLYWHFVDIVWIFLFPLLYLVGAHVH